MMTLAIPTDADALAVPGPLQGQWTYADWERQREKWQDKSAYICYVAHGQAYTNHRPLATNHS